ncbi:MAG: hypothetical protein CMK59_00455 [Proteobacteria bacterium]|nr:hypothetical protein [Pseudomonadota bacterium]
MNEDLQKTSARLSQQMRLSMTPIVAQINKVRTSSPVSLCGSELCEFLITRMMQLMVIFYAEDRGLMIESSFSLTALHNRLRSSDLDTLKQSHTEIQELQNLFQKTSPSNPQSMAHWNTLLELNRKTSLNHLFKSIDDFTLLTLLNSIRTLDDQPLDFKSIDVLLIGSVYEQLLDVSITADAHKLILTGISQRRNSGTHYTPRILCEFTVRETLEPHIAKCIHSEDLLKINICDPAMGSGALLICAARYLAEQHTKKCSTPLNNSLALVISKCIYGVDKNPIAVSLAQLSLWLEAGDLNLPFSALLQHLKCSNSILGTSGAHRHAKTLNTPAKHHTFTKSNPHFDSLLGDWIIAAHLQTLPQSDGSTVSSKTARLMLEKSQSQMDISIKNNRIPAQALKLISTLKDKPIHWDIAFSEVFESKGGFDAIVANPPFINCIRGPISKGLKQLLRIRYPIISGSADLSYYFLSLASEIIHSKGTIGIILPRVSMGAKALESFRAAPQMPKPYLIYSANHYRFFSDANIKVAVYILGKSSSCRVSDAELPDKGKWSTIGLNCTHWWPSYRHNWWTLFSLACSGKNLPQTSNCKALKEFPFEICGGLTTGEFYKIKVSNKKSGPELKLLTSGSIEPDASLWGKEKTRFGGAQYLHPRIFGSSKAALEKSNTYSKSLIKKLKRSHRPKIIIASLTRIVEAFLDEHGEYQASTATQTIFHHNDDIEQLRKLCSLLHEQQTNFLFEHILGYNAMHSSISMEKSFLENFPVPQRVFTSS